MAYNPKTVSYTHLEVYKRQVQAYWHIGESSVAKQKGLERAEYGSKLIQQLSKRMTADFGKGFTVANLKNMRQFFLTFPKGYALRSELSWTHYRMLMRITNNDARQFYLEECAQGNWSTRELERQIDSRAYERLLGKPTFASLPDGLLVQNGQPYEFTGYVDGYDEKIARVEFSLDRGETWTKYDIGDMDRNKMVWWSFTYKPELEGAYCLTVRATTESGMTSFETQTVMFNAKDKMPNPEDTTVLESASLIPPKVAAASDEKSE